MRTSIRIPLLLLAMTLLCSVASVATAQVPIVYVRCPRTTDVVEMSGDITIGGVPQRATRTMRGFDAYDVLPDVTNFLTGFTAPCDLVYREASGEERVLYDCSSTSTEEASCAAMDPAVSFDGRTIAFSVFRGSLAPYRQNINGRVLDPSADSERAAMVSPAFFPNRRLDATGAQLYLVDVATGETTELPGLDAVFDTGPAFLANGRLAFTSTRDGNTSTMVWGTNSSRPGTRIWTMDLDGRNVDLASHHSLSMEEHPYALRDGRLAYSSWQIFGGLPFRYTNGTVGGFTTIANLFHIYTQTPDGAVNFPFYGQHSGDHAPSYFGASHIAAHFLTQTGDGRVWFADYYRGNNNGLGIIVGVMSEPPGQEGIAPEDAETNADVFVARDAVDFAPWASNGDQVSAPMPDPPLMHPSYTDPLPFVGKLGHPAALPDNGLMLAWGKGPCSTVTGNRIFEALGRTAPPHTSGSGQGTAINLITSLGLDTPSCDVGVYRATVIPSVHPSDLEVIVDSPDWHEFMARAVVPYEDIHGVPRPDSIARADTLTSRSELEVGTPFGLLGAASIIDRETFPRAGIHFAGEHQFHGQGTDTINYADEDLCGVRILGVLPNRDRNTWRQIANVAGERVAILGEVSVRNRDAAGAPVTLAGGEPDTSFLVRMPANTPYLMQGIDCDGRTLNTDQTWQHLRPGEMKTCGGCHVHSRASRSTFGETFAATDAYRVARLGEGTVPLLAGEVAGEVQTRSVDAYGLQIDFARDIFPIFERRCVSCHGGATPMGNLALDRPGTDGIRDTDTPSTWWCLVADRAQLCLPESARFDTGAGRSNTSFRRPQLTHYVRAFNSRSSLLYWKAAGERTDGNTDDTFTEASPREDQDIDYGPAHPSTEITAEELGLLSRWIDIGSPGGPMELLDTQRPTLHLAAIVDGGAVSELRVGTVDLGGGVDPASLTVCLLGPAGECEDLSGDAALAGVVSVPLDAAVSDPDAEVFASVRDVAGNETTVRRTIGWLLDTPPPPPPGFDGGPGLGDGGVGGGGGDGDPGGGCGCRASSPAGSGGWWWVVAGALALRRRRSAEARP